LPLLFSSSFFLPSFGLTLSLLSLSNHTLTPLQVYKAKEKSTGRLVALKKTRLEVRKKKIHSTAGRRQLSLLVESLGLPTRNGRGGEKALKKQEAASDDAALSLSLARARESALTRAPLFGKRGRDNRRRERARENSCLKESSSSSGDARRTSFFFPSLNLDLNTLKK